MLGRFIMGKKLPTKTNERDMTRKVALTGVFAALILVATQIRIPTGIGYINLGDGVTLYCGFLLGPVAGIAAGTGSALSDLLAEYPQYILPTFLIRGAMGLVSGLMLKNSKTVFRKILAFLLCECIMLGGYFGFECFFYGWRAATGSLLMNGIQAAVGLVLAMLLTDAKRNLSRLSLHK